MAHQDENLDVRFFLPLDLCHHNTRMSPSHSTPGFVFAPRFLHITRTETGSILPQTALIAPLKQLA